MGAWIDFRELRSKLHFKDVLDKYQVRLQIRSSGKQAVGPCPLPNHGGDRTKQSFSANLEKGVFQCFSCEAKGNVLDFACLMENVDPKGEEIRKVALSLAKEFNILQQRSSPTKSAPKPERKQSVPSGKVLINPPLDFELKELDSNHEYLRKRGFDTGTIQMFGLGYCSRGRMAGRIAIPIHDTAGKLIGYAGRIVEEANDKSVPKYLFPGTRMHNGVTYEFKKSLLLYNAHRVKGKYDKLILVEGFPSVWWLTQNGFPNCVAAMGSNLSQEQADLALFLGAREGSITIFPDRDEAGAKFAEQAEKLFTGKIQTRCVSSIDGVQPTDLVSEELADILATRERLPAGIGGGFSPRHDICDLINQFPCFEHLGIRPESWDAEAFEQQAGKFSSGELSVAQFILGIWNPRAAWKCGKFDLIEAAARLDDEHRQPIIDWFSDPWWP